MEHPMNRMLFRQKRANFFTGNLALNVAFTRAVYRRVRPCTNAVYSSVYIMPAKSSHKASKFPNMTRAMAQNHRPAKSFLLPSSKSSE
jgi:hypothetical protein